jgi:hypothetical protein
MERGIFLRCWATAGRAAKNWYRDLRDSSGCRSVAYNDPETDDRAERIDAHCQNQCCEQISLGRFGSPGPVQASEKLYRVLIAPIHVDLDTSRLLITAISHTEKNGMSVLRESANRDEFRKIAGGLLERGNERSVFGVAEILCTDLRSLKESADSDRRRSGDRHFIAVDTDMKDLPSHVDIFSTTPRPKTNENELSNKAIWKRERKKLFDLAAANLFPKSEFKNGLISDI